MSLAAFAALAASASLAQPVEPSRIAGWWRTSLSHAGESRDLWLHIEDRGGKLIAAVTIPEIGAKDSPLSRVEDRAQSVELTSIGWSLRKEADGTFSGTITDALVPAYPMPVRFVRAAEPPQQASPKPAKAAPHPLWSRDLGSPVYAGIAFDRARRLALVATDSGKVVALHAGNGKTAWSIETGSTIRATPVVDGRAAYVATDESLLKVDAGTGRRIWSARLGKSKSPRLEIDHANSRWDHYGSSAVVAGNSVFVGSRDGCVYRFSATTGARRRTYCATDMITGTPVVDGNRIYFASFDKSVYAASVSSGRILWKRDVRGEVPRDLALVDGKLVAGSRSYDLVALDTVTGRPAWTRYYWFSWVDSPPNVVGSTVYVGASDGLRVYALDGETGRRIWESRVGGWTWAKPAIGRTIVYASVTGTAMPYVGPRSGGFAAIDRGTGRLRWLLSSAKPAKLPVYGFASAPVVAGGIVFAADLAGRVMAFTDE
jgi:outer membrane protein assembly factor BamB